MRIRFLRRLFYKGKYFEKKEKDELSAMLLPSMLGIVICAVCLAGTSFAWFTVSQDTQAQTIQAANYSVEASLDGELLTGATLLAAGTHTIRITPDGTSSTGYCILDIDGTEYHTEQIAKDMVFTATLVIPQPVMLKVTAQWGTSASTEEALTGGAVLSVGNAQ